jgi:predicted nucleic acid-binding Zn ribbon protein
MTDANRDNDNPPVQRGFTSEPVEQATPETDHQETGLELARSIARSLARGKRRGQERKRARTTPQASGAHPDDRDPQPLDTSIGRLIEQQGWGTDVRVHGVFSRWDVIVGRDVAQHARPTSYTREDEGGRLVVQTDSTAWATQMRMLAGNLVRRLNEELGDGTVTVIDVQGPAAPSWRRGRRSVRDGRGPRDTYG